MVEGAAPPYTGLIEAALLILPPKTSWSVGRAADRGEALVADTYLCTANTPALALCAAALYAFAATRKCGGKDSQLAVEAANQGERANLARRWADWKAVTSV